jgi:hypothetical protein
LHQALKFPLKSPGPMAIKRSENPAATASVGELWNPEDAQRLLELRVLHAELTWEQFHKVREPEACRRAHFVMSGARPFRLVDRLIMSLSLNYDLCHHTTAKLMLTPLSS